MSTQIEKYERVVRYDVVVTDSMHEAFARTPSRLARSSSIYCA